MAHVVLFSSDLELRYDQLIDYYHLRFQIEFNFRDAKQYWGLEDFMTVNQTPVYNSANLAMFMVNLSHALIRPIRTHIRRDLSGSGLLIMVYKCSLLRQLEARFKPQSRAS